jgi:S1-C subfamily serine protease
LTDRVDGPDVDPDRQLAAPSFDGSGGGPVLNLRGEVVGMRLERRSLDAGRDRPALPDIDLPDLPDVPDLPDLPNIPALQLPDVAVDRPVASSAAVPIGTLERVAGGIIADGRVRHPYLGVGLAAVTPRLAVERGLPAAAGALVLKVEPNGPAATAGLLLDDVILALDGERIDAGRSFPALLLERRHGERIRLTVRRGNDEIDIEAVLGERPED